MTPALYLGFQLFFPSYGLIAIGLVIGSAIWIITAKRRPSITLSFTQRCVFSLLLLGILIGWWQASEAAHRWQTAAGVKHVHFIFARTLPDELTVEPPVSASFSKPEIRVLDGRHVLLLQTPARMEWIFDDRYSVVTITFGFDPTSYEKGTTNGAVIILDLVDHGVKKEVFRRALDPLHRATDRGPQEASITIPTHSPDARLVLVSDPGESGDTSWDWVYLGKFRFGPVTGQP